jgi:integrase
MGSANDRLSDPDLVAYRRSLLAQGYAAGTVKHRVDVVRLIAAAASVAARDLQHEHIEAYLYDRELAVWTRRKYLEHVRLFAAWAGITDPTQGMRRPRRPTGLPKPVTEDELKRLLAAANRGTPDRLVLLLGAYAGLRSFEIAKVRGDDLAWGNSGPFLRVHGKGGRLDLVPVSPVLAAELAVWIARVGTGPLMPGMHANKVQHRVSRIAKRAGLDLSVHQLRHRYGTALYASTKDLLLTQKLMRHSSPTTTAGYALLDDGLGAAAVALLPGAEELAESLSVEDELTPRRLARKLATTPPDMPDPGCPSWCTRDHVLDWEEALTSAARMVQLGRDNPSLGLPASLRDVLEFSWEPMHLHEVYSAESPELRATLGLEDDMGCAGLYLEASGSLTPAQALELAEALRRVVDDYSVVLQPAAQ